MRVPARLHGTAAVAVCLCLAFSAWGADVPLGNWEVPRSPMADLGNPGAFVPVTPCRIADTRGVAPFTGAYAGPQLAAGATRSFDIDSAPTCTGIPVSTAYSLNFTIIGSAGGYQNAFLTVWPTGGTQPTVSTLNFDGGQLKANAAIVPRGTNGAINVYVNANAHLLVDINGYYTTAPNVDYQFKISGYFDNMAAIVGFNYSSVNGSHAIGGYAGGTGLVHGVQGQIGNGAAAGSSGVHGIGGSTGRITHAILGENNNAVVDSAAVLGRVTAGTPPTISGLALAAGVRGEAEDRGVIGVAGPIGIGARGFSVNQFGVVQTYGSLGHETSYGVYSGGNTGATGTKSFVEPHPTDATKVIKFVSLEGPEAGTYFRGSAFTVGGVAVIDVPEAFRLVTDPEGLTVQVTTVGSPARAWIESESLDAIVVRSSSDTKLHYLVQGVRKAYRDFQPIVPGEEFVPETPAQQLPLYLSEEAKQRLIANGTYNPDGTVNMETAERLGWARQWREREAGRK